MPFLQNLTGKAKKHTFIQPYKPTVHTTYFSVTAVCNNSLAYSIRFFVIIYGRAENIRFARTIHIEETKLNKISSVQYCQFHNKNFKKFTGTHLPPVKVV
jgi:hypothetical protein